ncbi:32384_t:CDS:1, partial [Gigaspora margarita]
FDSTKRDKKIEFKVKTKIDYLDNKALKIIKKAAKMNHINKVSKSGFKNG